MIETIGSWSVFAGLGSILAGGLLAVKLYRRRA